MVDTDPVPTKKGIRDVRARKARAFGEISISKTRIDEELVLDQPVDESRPVPILHQVTNMIMDLEALKKEAEIKNDLTEYTDVQIKYQKIISKYSEDELKKALGRRYEELKQKAVKSGVPLVPEPVDKENPPGLEPQ